MPYRLTSDYRGRGGMDVATESEFSKAIHKIFVDRKPKKIIETGTHLGLGTTQIIHSALLAAEVKDAKVITIECNPGYYNIARQNLIGYNFDIRLGLSVPKPLIPSKEQIEQEVVINQASTCIWVDGQVYHRAVQYYTETDFNVQDDQIGKAVTEFEGCPDFVLLDSAGHMGFVEFEYLIPRLLGACVIALDDTNHVKHYRSVQSAKNDKRFTVLAESDEKFGFTLFSFVP